MLCLYLSYMDQICVTYMLLSERKGKNTETPKEVLAAH